MGCSLGQYPKTLTVPDFPRIQQELRRKGVTLQRLREEYGADRIRKNFWWSHKLPDVSAMAIPDLWGIPTTSTPSPRLKGYFGAL